MSLLLLHAVTAVQRRDQQPPEPPQEPLYLPLRLPPPPQPPLPPMLPLDVGFAKGYQEQGGRVMGPAMIPAPPELDHYFEDLEPSPPPPEMLPIERLPVSEVKPVDHVPVTPPTKENPVGAPPSMAIHPWERPLDKLACSELQDRMYKDLVDPTVHINCTLLDPAVEAPKGCECRLLRRSAVLLNCPYDCSDKGIPACVNGIASKLGMTGLTPSKAHVAWNGFPHTEVTICTYWQWTMATLDSEPESFASAVAKGEIRARDIIHDAIGKADRSSGKVTAQLNAMTPQPFTLPTTTRGHQSVSDHADQHVLQRDRGNDMLLVADDQHLEQHLQALQSRFDILERQTQEAEARVARRAARTHPTSGSAPVADALSRAGFTNIDAAVSMDAADEAESSMTSALRQARDNASQSHKRTSVGNSTSSKPVTH